MLNSIKYFKKFKNWIVYVLIYLRTLFQRSKTECIVFYMHISIRNIFIELRAKFYIQLEHVKMSTYVCG